MLVLFHIRRWVLLTVACLFLLAVPISVGAEKNKSKGVDIMKQVSSAGEKAGLVAEDPRLYVTEGIKIILGFIAILFIALIVYAGYLRLTAHGEEDRVKKSTSTVIAALIGLIIVMFAYAITSFVSSRMYNAIAEDPKYEENNYTAGYIENKVKVKESVKVWDIFEKAFGFVGIKL